MVMNLPEKGLNIHLYSLLPLQNSQITLLKQTKQPDITKADRALTKMFLQTKISGSLDKTFKISHFSYVVQKTKPLSYVIQHL